MENTKYGRRREGRWTPTWVKAQDTRANPNSWDTHLVTKRWDIGLLWGVEHRDYDDDESVIAPLSKPAPLSRLWSDQSRGGITSKWIAIDFPLVRQQLADLFQSEWMDSREGATRHAKHPICQDYHCLLTRNKSATGKQQTPKTKALHRCRQWKSNAPLETI